MREMMPPFLLDKGFIQKAYISSLLLISLSIFLPVRAAGNFAIALLIIVWLVEGNFKTKMEKLKSTPIAVISIALFLLYLTGLLYTQNTEEGIKYMETKASLLIFPVVLGSAAIQKESLLKTVYFFAWSCVLFSLLAFLYQIKVVAERNDINYIFSDGLVLIYSKQAVYFSIYVAFSILVLLQKLWFGYLKLGFKKKVLLLLAVSFLFLMLFLLASRTSLLILILIVFSTALVLGIRKGNLKIAFLFIAGAIVFFTTLSLFLPQVFLRFESLKNYSFDFQNKSSEFHFAFENSEESWNGLNLRLAKWVCAIDLIKQNPVLGVGTGDIKDELVEAYLNRDFFYAAEKRYDPHNQFFETTVAVGLVGLILACSFFFYPLYSAIRKKYWLFAAFMVLLIFCALTESILSSSQGIIFICFFMLIFTRLSQVGVNES